MKLLDRYIIRNFVEPFLMCFCGFIAIWLIIDLNDNHQDFLEAHASLRQVTGYYLTQLPSTILFSLPVGLLLALLSSLSAMSRRNEIISMLTAGRSVLRVLAPVLCIGVLAAGGSLWLNWKLAPHAEGIKKVAMKQIRRRKQAGEIEPVNGHLFRDRLNDRTWFIRRFYPGPGLSQFDDVHIMQQTEDGKITRKWYAQHAIYEASTKTWVLENGMIVEFNDAGDIESTDPFLNGVRRISGWTETPWRVSSSQLDPGNLSIPELQDYMRYNSDFPQAQLAPYRTNLSDRWALPLSCLIVVLIAAPLGIVYNRRGVLAGVATGIFIFFAMMLTRYLFLALGKGDRVNPTWAPWIPDIVFGAVGLVLLWFRSTNRDMPSLSFFKKRKSK
jgi:lipopolysaccharide export system permease protein